MRLDNSLTCCIRAGICTVSVDYLALPASKTQVKIGTLPCGLKPIGTASNESVGEDAAAYIAPLAYRGVTGRYGQMLVSRQGNIYAYVSDGGSAAAYYYGQLVFPVSL